MPVNPLIAYLVCVLLFIGILVLLIFWNIRQITRRPARDRSLKPLPLHSKMSARRHFNRNVRLSTVPRNGSRDAHQRKSQEPVVPSECAYFKQ
ncbi:Protein CBG26240 [Caenorhabditis briggsae]|uniref:Uncharacterized protein n=2 Tax=Caenorhabditis briggsae TaxID=6238 RepID=A0AAE9A6K8_CAEBR|nr:Protein CBG26240 [Caenorhabditis briggsae]ULT93371.1 hypothetical protein L3Y34_003098 [Caenorhabditis briggsae]CAS00891.1 Protein CBG26240 [Caenorhabditis briggsae]